MNSVIERISTDLGDRCNRQAYELSLERIKLLADRVSKSIKCVLVQQIKCNATNLVSAVIY
jgi:hypothetical protein